MKSFFGNVRGGHVSVEQLSSYLDNQVDKAERALVDSHLRTCVTCQTELQSLRQTVAMLQAMPRVPVPRAFTLSQAQVGQGRPAQTAMPGWMGGLVRAGAALTALLLVAVLGITLLNRGTGSTPAQPQIARQSNPAAATQAEGMTDTPTAAEAVASQAAMPAPAVAPAAAKPAATTAPAAPQAQPPAAPAAAAATGASRAGNAAVTATAPQPTQASRALAAQPTEAPAAVASPAPAPMQAPAAAAPAITAPAAPSTAAKSAAPTATQNTVPPAPATAPAAAAAQAPAAALRADGQGGGFGGPNQVTPEPPPPAASLSTTLPASAALAYGDWQSIWAVDRSGSRRLVQAQGATLPLVSPDRSLVAYRVVGDQSVEIWVVRWDGSGQRRLLRQQDLPTNDLGQQYEPRQLLQHELRWVPGTHQLSVRTLASAKTPTVRDRDELWHLDVDNGALRRVLDLGVTGYHVYAPNGKSIAVLQRGNEQNPEGNLTLYRADGTGQQKALSFKANPNGYGFESQLSWLPDSSGLWLALPSPESGLDEPAADLTLYRVGVDGKAQAAGNVRAASVYWSPDGKQLAYTRPVTETMEVSELVLANANGSDPKVYTTLHYGSWGGWSPDGAHFLYQHEGHAYLGTAGKAPQVVSGMLDAMSARWVSPQQFLYPSYQPNGTVVVSQVSGGKAASIATWPQDATFDVVPAR